MRVQEFVGTAHISSNCTYTFWTYGTNEFDARRNATKYHQPGAELGLAMGRADIKPLLRKGKPSFLEAPDVFS
jgi:hypothetical protein